jgi:tetratricopeptide (TPR) repeat protein
VPLKAQLIYEKGGIIYEVSEAGSAYKVTCRMHKHASGSREYSLAVSQSRLTAKNLIGIGVIFRKFANANKLDDSYFQMFTDCVNYSYKAEMQGMDQKRTVSGREIIYECPKKSYKLQEATYDNILDLKDLTRIYYAKHRDSDSAKRYYESSKGSISSSLSIVYDFLSGKAQVPGIYKKLQAYNDRFLEAAYSESNPTLESLVASAASAVENTGPFRILSVVELVTNSFLKDKSTFYGQFKKSLSKNYLFERVLAFCAIKCAKPLPKEGVLTTDIILAYPGAISPFAISNGLESDYTLAANLYSQLKFDEAATLLEKSINLNGITDKHLCLLGASLRLAGKPAQALPYLILCSYLNPNTEYLFGNIILCLSELKFKELKVLALDFKDMNPDPWSLEQLNLF